MIDFELQGVTPSFPGFGETRLQVGYEWDKDARTMGDPVISLRDGRDKIIWVHSLGEQEGEADGGTITRPPKPRPTLPTLGVSAAESDDSTGTEET